MIDSDIVRNRICNVLDGKAKFENKYPNIKIDVLGAPAGQISYDYKREILKYKLLIGTLKANFDMYKLLTGKKHELQG